MSDWSYSESGRLIVPLTKSDVAMVEAAAYTAAHKACPKCGSLTIWATCMGMLTPGRDTNRASCSCGWRGIVDDLVPRGETLPAFTVKEEPKSKGKSPEQFFRDWYHDLFGSGYGTGEEHIIPALKAFFEAVPAKGCWDYQELERAVTPPVAWLLIEALSHLYEYGSSPRFAWLKENGLRLKQFLAKYSADELYTIATGWIEEDCYGFCGRDYCNCEEYGLPETEKGKRCPNPFGFPWVRGD